MVFVLFLFLSSPVWATGDNMPNSNNLLIISRLQTTRDVSTRRAMIESLHQFLLAKGSINIDIEVISNLASVLDDPDEIVRYWAAMCLGDIGPRAISVAPKLQSLLAQAPPLQMGKGAESGYRFALTQMGIPTP